jgi:DsbC/DsbD-like thiol-disulfide interchange protein
MLVWMAALLLTLPTHLSGVRATIVSSDEAIQPGRQFTVGVRFEIPEGWHIYWKNPGDSGMATSIAWSLPKGFVTERLLWPVPAVVESSSGTTYGYEGSVVLLTRITAPSSLKVGTVAAIRAQVRWLECQEACLPGSADLSVRLPVSARARTNDRAAAELKAAYSGVPAKATGVVATSVLQAAAYRLEFALPPSLRPSEVKSAYFFPTEPEVISHSAKQMLSVDGSRVRLLLQKSEYSKSDQNTLKGVVRLTYHDGSDCSIELDAPVKKPIHKGRQ